MGMAANRVLMKVLVIVLACIMLGSTIVAFPSVVYSDTQTELIVNGGFESGLSGWSVSGDFHADPGFSYSHSGTRYAYLSTATGNPGNNLVGNMYQTVSIPSSATSVTLTFWYNITTDETGTSPYDAQNVTIQNSAGSFLSTVASWSNLNKQPIGVYSQKIFDLTPYIGQVIRINFLGTTDGSLPTVFRIDDVSIIATSTPPPTLSFTSLTPGTVSTSQSTYVGTFSAVGTNFNNVNQITVTWSGPDSGSQTWNKGDSNWNAAVTVNSDTSMTLLIRVLSNETGTQTKTWTWTVTLKDTTNATASKSFTVTFNPPVTRIIGLSGDMDFGSVQVGASYTRTLTISNTGNSILNVSSITYPNGFSGNWAGGNIGANGGSKDVTVTFTPIEATTYTGTITVNSDKTGGTNTIACFGTGKVNQLPTCSVSPDKTSGKAPLTVTFTMSASDQALSIFLKALLFHHGSRRERDLS
jgi:hypothetical protein